MAYFQQYLFLTILQWQWQRPGSEVLENTHLILRGCAIPPSSVGFASRHRGGHCPTPQDLEGIFQYRLAMPRPLSHWSRNYINISNNPSILVYLLKYMKSKSARSLSQKFLFGLKMLAFKVKSFNFYIRKGQFFLIFNFEVF